jgi:hypothetical protein
VPDEKSAGRAPVRRSTRGRARVGQAVGKAVLPENAATDVFHDDAPTVPPVFVDPSGARRKWLRLTGYAIGVLVVVVLAAVWITQLTGSSTPPPPAPCASACGK